ncbi:MAG TPA: IS200/IS605 family transposase [Pirellulaceae bacterium]|nr:IS200/IS605 family transposase [Pirellulaceae bacterium]
MPQSLANVLLHVVFSTKNREKLLHTKEVRDVMTGYLIGTLQNLKCPSLQVGVVADHVHILCSLHRTLSIAKLVEEVKTSSSARIKEEGRQLANFQWQNGYGVFSVSPSNAPDVKQYVANQDEHHRQRTYHEEFRLLLARHGIEYDERYVWDQGRGPLGLRKDRFILPFHPRAAPWANESGAFGPRRRGKDG